MKKIFNKTNPNPIWVSTEDDWNDKNGDTIAIWQGCNVTPNDHRDFKKFVLDESGADIEPITTFYNTQGGANAVFVVKSNISNFAVWRFKVDGMRWWYDAFAEVNGGMEVSEEDMSPVLEKLGLLNK